MKNKEAKNKLVAVVRIRGRVNVRGSITETLKRLNLKRVSNCTIIKATDSYMGMLNKCSNYVAYGEIDPETLGKLMENRAKKQITFKPNEVFESIKGKDINKLLNRMI